MRSHLVLVTVLAVGLSTPGGATAQSCGGGGATKVTVPNADFESGGSWTGNTQQLPTSKWIDQPPTGPTTAWSNDFSNLTPGVPNPGISQTLTATFLPNKTYTLRVQIGKRKDLPTPTSAPISPLWWQIRLNAVNGATVTNVGLADSATDGEPDVGRWITGTVTFTTPPSGGVVGQQIQIWMDGGNTIEFGTAGIPRYEQANFDDVCLEYTTPIPSGTPPLVDLEHHKWVAIDGYGREVPTPQGGYPQASPSSLQPNRYLATFYILWHGEHHRYDNVPGPFNMTEIRAGQGSWGNLLEFHHWEEPENGFYLSSDDYIMERDALMLSNAGVDVVFLDGTNQHAYLGNAYRLMSTFLRLRRQGTRTPQIAFWAQDEMLPDIYFPEIYSQKLYEELWFEWDGKPLFLYTGADASNGYKNGVVDKPVSWFTTNYPQLGSTFTYRQAWMYGRAPGQPKIWYDDNNGANSDGKNKWISAVYTTDYKLGYGPGGEPGEDPEEVSANTAFLTHHVPPCSAPVAGEGRSYTDQFCQGNNPEGGACFEEQYQTALNALANTQRPQLIWVQDWNEWSAQLYRVPTGSCGCSGQPGCPPAVATCGSACGLPPCQLYHAKTLKTGGDEYTIDQWDQEHSRNVQPMSWDATNTHTDNFYYQLVALGRLFKGAESVPLADDCTIHINGWFYDWNCADATVYRDPAGDVSHRDHAGIGYWDNLTEYTNTTGRNDIVMAKASHQKVAAGDFVYFYLKTADPISIFDPWSPDSWMVLYIDTDADPSTGWNGFEFRVKRKSNGMWLEQWLNPFWFQTTYKLPAGTSTLR